MGWHQECRQAAAELSQEKRQQFLDKIWDGKTIGESCELEGISFDAANGILLQNIERHDYTTLRRVAV